MFLADKLLLLVATIRKARREQRDRVAVYCESVAHTLSQAFKQLERGIFPHGLCAEMDRHMHHLRDVLEKTLSKKDFDDLRDALHVAYRVEHIDQELPDPPRAGSKYAELDIAAGKFRAVAEKIRATN
jgi:hypothetical protein